MVESTPSEIPWSRRWTTSTVPTMLPLPHHPFYPQLHHRPSIGIRYGTLDPVRGTWDTPEVTKRLHSRNKMGIATIWNCIQCRLTTGLLQLLCSLLLFLLLINYFSMDFSWMEHGSLFAPSGSDLLQAMVCRHTRNTIWIASIGTCSERDQQSPTSFGWCIVKRLSALWSTCPVSLCPLLDTKQAGKPKQTGANTTAIVPFGLVCRCQENLLICFLRPYHCTRTHRSLEQQ